jgi:NDP-sugar pyrophosphorylase family protein
MILILTMAGNYTRFKNFSYEIPKYLLPISRRSILHYVLKCFPNDVFERVVLTANNKDLRFKSQVARTLEEFRFNKTDIIYINNTLGQSETAKISLEKINIKLNQEEKNRPVIIHNIDTILLNRDFKQYREQLKLHDCLVDVFESNKSSYSYVLSKEKKVSHIVEKKVISNLASSGCYGFKSLNTGLECMSNSKESHYISEGIMNMILENQCVITSEMHLEEDTLVLGTPEEYIGSMEYFDLISFGDQIA